jgi:Kef-type K+ transport system membrane component KefB
MAAQLILTLSLMIIGASLAALVARWLKQPMILGYVLAGIILGPGVSGLISDPEPIALLSELGLIFLMFMIGLELDLSKLKDVGSISILIGALQVGITTLIGALIASLTSFTFVQGLYLGLLISFSSTLVVVKVLVDRHELSALHGELALGILVVQDILAVVALSLLGALSEAAELPGGLPTFQDALSWFGFHFPSSGLGLLLNLAVAGALFALLAFVFFRLIIPQVSKSVSSSSELFFVSTLAAVFLVALLAGFFSFSFAIGAFVAGIALSSSLHSHDIIGRVKPLRDFFLILFFVSLGLQVLFVDFLTQFWLILFLLIGSLVIKPVITFFLLRVFHYNNRTSFLTSIHLAQVGEFGLILVSAGVLSGMLPKTVLTGAVISTVLTMTLTVYVMRYDEVLYIRIRPLLAPLNRFISSRREEQRSAPARYAPNTAIFGVKKTTSTIIELLGKQKRKLLLVDANEHRLLPYKGRGIPIFCTDPLNDELYEHIDFSKTELVVSVVSNRSETLAGPDPNVYLIKKLRLANPDVVIIIAAETEDIGRRLQKAGATLVLVPSLIERKVLQNLLSHEGLDEVRALGKAYGEELQRRFMYLRT